MGRSFAAVCTPLLVSGCVLAAAGAGAGGGVYLTSRGVESIVTVPVGRAFSATERAFGDFKIKRTSLKVDEEGEEREVKGESENGELAVTVTLTREAARSTRVEVTARRTLVTWDKDFARAVLEKIVEFAN